MLRVCACVCACQRACRSLVGLTLLQEAMDSSDPQRRLLPRGERPDHGHPGQLRSAPNCPLSLLSSETDLPE